MSDLNKKENRYEKIDRVGEGTYGIVYKAKDIKNLEIVALKKIRLVAEEEGIPSTAIREIAILKDLNHVNIVKLIDVMHSLKKLVLVFEFVERDLKKIIDEHKEEGMKEDLVKSFLFQLLMGINYMHESKYLHRDLKPQNLLISDKMVLKIADFGLARGYGIPTKNYTNEVVTLWYRPPDVLLGSKEYMTSVDIWSIGCIFAEMINGKALFQGTGDKDQVKKIFMKLGTPSLKTYPELDLLPEWSTIEYDLYEGEKLSSLCPKLDSSGLDLLGKMLQINPKNRISTGEALKHPYFKNLPSQLKDLYKEKTLEVEI